MTPPGWSASQVAAAETFSQIVPCKVGDGELAAVDGSGQVVVIEPLDGTVKRRLGKPNGAVPAGSILRAEGNFLFVTMVSPTKVEVDVCNLTTGDWRPRVAGDAPQGYGPPPVALFYQDELRVITSGGILLRWKADDLSPLEARTYQIPTNAWNAPAENFRAVGTAFGDSFCAGVMRRGLVLEKDGVWTVKSYPSSVYPADASSAMAVSERWMALDTVGISNSRGLLFWDKQAPDSAPVRMTYTAPLHTGTFSGNRFLLQQVKSADSPYINTLRVIDLTSIRSISLPMDMGDSSFPRVTGMSGGQFWMFEKNTTASAFPSNGQVLRTPVAISPGSAKVNISNATVSGESGALLFYITVDRPLDQPVTLELATRDGTARGGSDFTPWSGTVTLTPQFPFTTVSVNVLPDKKPETYESLFLDVRSCTGAWIGNATASGLIWDTPFRKLPPLPPLPGEPGDGDYFEWALVPSGVVKYAIITKNHKRTTHAIRARPGDKAWQFLQAPLFPDGSTASAEDTVGDIVCFARKFFEGYDGARVVDVASDRLLGTYNPDGYSLALSDKGIVFFRKGTPGRLEYHRFDKPGSPVWVRPITAGECTIRRHGNGQFVHTDVGGVLYVRNFSDGSLVRVIQPRIGGLEPVPVSSNGDDSVIVTNACDFSSLASPTGTTRALRATSGYLAGNRDAWISGCGVTGHGVGWYPSQRLNVGWDEPDYVFTLLDRGSGMKVGEITSLREIRPVHTADGMISYAMPSETLEILQTWMPLPEPTTTLAFKTAESDTPYNFEFDLATAVDFNITARVVSANPDVRTSASVVVKAGTKRVRIPLVVIRDGVPEKDEVVPVTLQLSGNGVVRNHAVTVTVPANDHTFLKTPSYNKDIINGSSVALHPSGFIIGNQSDRYAADYRYKKVYPPDRDVKKPASGYGRTVALDAAWLAVGVPFTGKGIDIRETDKVFLYDRKTGKEKHVLTGKDFRGAFGSVLRFGSGKLVVGAPGLERAGTVSVFDLKNGASRRIFKQPGKAFNKGGFGSSVAILGNSLWVGAPGVKDGRVFQFDVRTGKFIREFKPLAGHDAFGHAMEIVGNRLAVSAPSRDGRSAVFLYNVNNGKPAGRIDGPFTDGGGFGASLAVLKGKVLAVGCPRSAFSPSGGVLLYSLNAKKPAFLTMLCPSRLKDENDMQYFSCLGAAGSLSGAENVLAVAVGARGDVLDLLKERSSEIIILQINTALKAALLAAPAPLADSSTDPWEKALGAGASADDCPVRISTAGGKSTVVLPQVISLATGSRLILESSTDLAKWKPVAVLEGGGESAWASVIEGITIDSLSNQLELPLESPASYFRIRCEAP